MANTSGRVRPAASQFDTMEQLMSANPPKDAAVWFEIPVSDMNKAKAFYGAVVQGELIDQNDGPNPVAMFPVADMSKGVSGHLYPGEPSKTGCGSTVHLAAPDKLEGTLKRVTDAGGEVVSPVITIPPGRFAYCLDPDGNSFSMFEPA